MIAFILLWQIFLPLIIWIFSAVSRLISKDNNPDNISDVKILSIKGESGKYVFVLEHAGKEYDFRTDAKDEEILKKLAAEIVSHLDNGIAYEILYEHSKRVME